MVMSHHIPGTRAVFTIPHLETLLLPRDSPNVVKWRIHFLGDAGDEGGAAVGLCAYRCSGRAMNVNPPPQPGPLRIAQHDGTHPAALKTNGRNDRIVNLDTGMVVGVPITV